VLDPPSMIALINTAPVLYVKSAGSSAGILESGVQEIIKRIDTLAASMKLDVIDMHAALVDKPQLLSDRVNPNTEDAAEMAKAAFAALTGKAVSAPATK